MKKPHQSLQADVEGQHPACFRTAQEFREYEAGCKADGLSYDGNYCLDCTPEHKKRMMSALRCEHPETEFVSIPNYNDIVGISIRSKYWKLVEKKFENKKSKWQE